MELAWQAYTTKRYAGMEAILSNLTELTLTTKTGAGLLYPEAVHISHTLRGLVALRTNDIELAKQELMKSALVPRSPMLSILGPNMQLAKELLERGERDAVLTFLRWCRRFWYLPTRLYFSRGWKRQIERGEIPDFKGHLQHYIKGKTCELKK